jgi:hypothetical protein
MLDNRKSNLNDTQLKQRKEQPYMGTQKKVSLSIEFESHFK